MERLTKMNKFPNGDKEYVVDTKLASNREAIQRLAYFEDLEEQGLLIKLPCRVGDKIGLYAQTRQEMQAILAKMKLEHTLKQYSKLCTEDIDWNDCNQRKYYIRVGDMGDVEIDNDEIDKNQIYFTDRKILGNAIRTIGEEILLKEYFIQNNNYN